MKAALAKYEEFHQFLPSQVGSFARGFAIPRKASYVGEAIHVCYRSNKLEPGTGKNEGVIDYIHEHKPGVRAFRTDRDADGPIRNIPQWIWRSRSLTRLGLCLDFCYRDKQGDTILGEMLEPLPELYCTPNGHALLIIETKRTVKAILYGGKLRVERRGIIG